MKKSISLVVIFIMVLSASCVFAEVDDSVSVRVNDELIESTDKNYIVNDRVFVLARDVAESLGAIVEWQNATREVTIRLDNQIITFNIDSFTADVDGEIKVMDAMPFLKNERTYVPVRFLSENLGFSVQWDGINRTVDICSNENLVSRSNLDVQHSYTKEDLLWLSRIVQVETGGSTIV
ncbi:MAG: copper amine oxidase N-terminal domain-containing protein, partial [Clostridiales bacterium]|nr:copper amine oxidase N-terminal domain-containing protein [Clostridiales bacterium]